MSDEQQNEPTESEDVEAHKLASKHASGKFTAGEADEEGGDDVEAHKMASKIAPKVSP